MKITKRRVTKRNRIKRKYSKKRTKTRHSRKRVFSKKRRKTIKKKKRGGMGLKFPKLPIPKLFKTKEEKAIIDLEEAKNKLQKSENDLFELKKTKKHFLELHDEIITNTKNANEDEKFNIISTYNKRVIKELKNVSKRLRIDYDEEINDQEKNIYNNMDIVYEESTKLKGKIERMFDLRIKSQENMIYMNKQTKTRMETELKEIQEKYRK